MEITVSFHKLSTRLVLFREGFPLVTDELTAPIRGMSQDERLRVVKEEFVRLIRNYHARWKADVLEVYIDPMQYGGVGKRDFCHVAAEAVRQACEIIGATAIMRPPDLSTAADAKKVCKAYKLGKTLPVLRCVGIALSLQLTLADDRLLPVPVPKKKVVLPKDPNQCTIPGLQAVLAGPLKKATTGKAITVKEFRLLLLYNFGRIHTAETLEDAKKVKMGHDVLMDLAKLEADGKTEQLEELAKGLKKQMDARVRRGNPR
jgi:hypothetical protein